MEIDIHQELEWVQEGIFTEPNDQSVWLYHNWLTTLARGTATPRITHCVRMQDGVFVFFSRSVCVSHASISCADGAKVDGHLQPIIPTSRSAVPRTRPSARRQRMCGWGWQFQAEGGSNNLTQGPEIRVTVCVEVFDSLPDGKKSPESSLDVSFHGPLIDLSAKSDASVLEAFLGQKLEEQRRDVFQAELERIKELLEIEPDCRWALLAEGRLQQGLASGCSADQQESVQGTVAESAVRISALDPLRKNFYSDAAALARARQKIQAWLAKDAYSNALDLSSLALRHLAPAIATFAFGVRILNMDSNRLSEFGSVLGLISLEEVSLSKNQIRGDVAEIFVLPKLRRANLSWNCLSLQGLQVPPPEALECVDLSGLEGKECADGPRVVQLLFAGSSQGDGQPWTAEVAPCGTCICRRP